MSRIIPLHKAARKVQLAHQRWRSVTQHAVVADVRARTGHPTSTAGNDVVAQEMVELRQAVRLGAITGKLVGVGPRSLRCWGRRQGAVRLRVQVAVTQFHELSTQRARVSPAAAILHMLSMVFGCKDQLAVLARAWPTATLVGLKSFITTTNIMQQQHVTPLAALLNG